MINVGQRLPENGRIKIGGNKWVPSKKYPGETVKIPEKWDWFKITTTEKDDKENWIIDNAMTEAVAHPDEENKLQPKRIGPCYLPLDSIDGNFHTTFGYYVQSRAICTSEDGITAKRLNEEENGYVKCECNPDTCEYIKSKHCRPSGILSVIFEKAPKFGGVYVLRTHSWNTVRSILSQMILYYSQTERMFGYGRLTGIPFYLALHKKRQKNSEGKMNDIRYVTLEFDGDYNAFCEFCMAKLQMPEPMMRPALNPTTQSLLDQKALTQRAASIVQDPEEWEDADDAEAEVVEEEPEPEQKPEPEKKDKPYRCDNCGKKPKAKMEEKGGRRLCENCAKEKKLVKCPKCGKKVEKLVENDGNTWCVECNAEYLLEPQINTEPISIEVMTNTKKYKWNVKQPVAVDFMHTINDRIKHNGREAVNKALAPYGVTIETLNEITGEAIEDIQTKIQANKEKQDDKPKPEEPAESEPEPPVEDDGENEERGNTDDSGGDEGGSDKPSGDNDSPDARTEDKADKDTQMKNILVKEILTECVINAKIDYPKIGKTELEIECVDFVRRVTGTEMKKFNAACLNKLKMEDLLRVESRVHKEIQDKKKKLKEPEEPEPVPQADDDSQGTLW